MGSRDHGARDAAVQGARWRQYAPRAGRLPRASLAQRGRVGLHHRGGLKTCDAKLIGQGECRITVLDTEGGCFIDDLKKGDLWYFPTGFPHGIQGGH